MSRTRPTFLSRTKIVGVVGFVVAAFTGVSVLAAEPTPAAPAATPTTPGDATPADKAAPAEKVAEAPVKGAVSAADRAALKAIGAQLPAHGLLGLKAPAADAASDVWQSYATKLVKRLAGRKRRKRYESSARPLAAAVAAFIPTHRRYRALQVYFRQLLEQLRKADVTIPKMRYRIAAGTTAPEVATLRKRLLLEGYSDRTVKGRRAQFFDKRLRLALRKWQRDHGLGETNEIDNPTRWALNKHDVLVAKVALAMKRWRQHTFSGDKGRRVIVDINAGMLTAERDGISELNFPIIAGRATAADATPALSSAITKVVVNPAWRVPRRIVGEFKHKFGGDADKLRARGYKVTVSGEKWRVTKPPGSANPLGKLIFRMPGTRGIFLHDTNSKALFDRKTRTMSHGCVRLKKPQELAHWVLPPSLHSAVDRQIGNGHTKHIRVPKPVPTHLVYKTLKINDAGHPVAVPDRYGRDRKALAKIRGGRLMKLRPPVASPLGTFADPAVTKVPETSGQVPAGTSVGGEVKPDGATPEPSAPDGGLPPKAAEYRLAVSVSPIAGGKAWTLDRYKGRLLVLTFVASWCSNCHLLAPQMKAAIDKLRAQGHDVALLGVGLEEGAKGAKAVAAYLAKHKFPFPVVMAGPALLKGTSVLGRIERLPVSWVVGKTGVPLYRHEGRGAALPLAEDLKRYIRAEANLAAP